MHRRALDRVCRQRECGNRRPRVVFVEMLVEQLERAELVVQPNLVDAFEVAVDAPTVTTSTEATAAAMSSSSS
jgi:hypothetical protein